MASVIRFPVSRHHRASAKAGVFSTEGEAFAASLTSNSAVTPADRAVSDARTESHHSEGMRSRCPHLRTAGTLAPMSSAMASGERQSPMMSLNEAMAGAVDTTVMAPLLGQSVLKSKANVSYDETWLFGQNVRMPDRMSETEERLAFVGRVKLAREARFATQKPMLTILGIDQGLYKQYETRTPLPHRFIPKFCAATGVSLEWLLTGEGKGPEMPEYERVVPKRMGRLRRGKAA